MGAQLLRHASAKLVLALSPVSAVPTRTHRTAAMWRVDPVLNRLLHHGVKSFSKAPVFGTNLITLLDHLHGLGFGDGIQATQTAGTGRDHRVGRQLQAVFG